MGFLSTYDGVERIPLKGGYWVDLRRYLSVSATEKSERHLQAITMVDGKPCPAPDVVRSRQERVLASVVDWNIDDDNGSIWPINMQSVRRLPDPVFERLREAVEGFAEPQAATEQAQFPDEDAVGDPDGDAGAPVAADVPDGTGAVQAAR